MDHIVVLTLVTRYDGVRRECASEEAAQAALAYFGHATGVERVDDEQGVRLLVACAEQRGDRSAFRLHTVASAYGVPVHIR